MHTHTHTNALYMNVYFPVLHTVVNYVYEMQEPHTWLTHHVAQAAVGMKALKHGPSNQGKESNV